MFRFLVRSVNLLTYAHKVKNRECVDHPAQFLAPYVMYAVIFYVDDLLRSAVTIVVCILFHYPTIYGHKPVLLSVVVV